MDWHIIGITIVVMLIILFLHWLSDYGKAHPYVRPTGPRPRNFVEEAASQAAEHVQSDLLGYDLLGVKPKFSSMMEDYRKLPVGETKELSMSMFANKADFEAALKKEIYHV